MSWLSYSLFTAQDKATNIKLDKTLTKIMGTITKNVTKYNELPVFDQQGFPQQLEKKSILECDSALWECHDQLDELKKRKEIIQQAHLHKRAEEEACYVKEDATRFLRFCKNQHELLNDGIIKLTETEFDLKVPKLAVLYAELLMLEKFFWQVSSMVGHLTTEKITIQNIVLKDEMFQPVIPWVDYEFLENLRQTEEFVDDVEDEDYEETEQLET